MAHEELLNKVNKPHHFTICPHAQPGTGQGHQVTHMNTNTTSSDTTVGIWTPCISQSPALSTSRSLEGVYRLLLPIQPTHLPASYLIPQAKPQHNGAAGLTSPKDQHSSSPQPWKASLLHAPARFVQIEAIPRLRQKAKCM